MIRKLRIKFVVINMTIVTILLSVILGLVYSFTRANLETQSVRMMQQIAGSPFRMQASIEPGEEVRLPYFALRLGPHGERMAQGGGYYDLSNEAFLDHLLHVARGTRARTGLMQEYNLRYCLVDGPRCQYLVFADISSEIATLDGLMKNCLLIGILGFLGFLGASILLSGWAVRPVDAAFRQQKKFIADASHELKTPLTVILTNAELLEQGVSPQTAGSNIRTMSRQMGNLIEQMLTLARADAGERKLVLGPVNLSKVISNGILPFEPVFFEKGLELSMDIDPDLEVLGDSGSLRKLLEILLDNAQKYATGKTWVTLKPQGKTRIRLTVSNEGDPIPPETLPHLFDRFYRADEARTTPGSFGLGLSIARTIAEKHKSKLWMESHSGINRCILEIPRKIG